MEAYRTQVQEGKLHEDLAQMNALEQLQALHEKLADYSPKAAVDPTLSAVPSSGDTGSWLSSLFTSSSGTKPEPTKNIGLPEGIPSGVYIYGGVGCGKTFIMDLFFDQTSFAPKRRVHFHAFMLEVHQRMHVLRSGGLKEDLIPHVVSDLLKDGMLLCFDEFQVTDVGDAVLLRRLFTSLLDQGAVVVATSNRPPKDLYYNGIQRELFVPFIDLLYERCVVHSMEESDTDYRLVKGAESHRSEGGESTYFQPLTEENTQEMNALFKRMTKGCAIEEGVLHVQGRPIFVPETAMASGVDVARFSFEELCARPLGAADFLCIARSFHTVFLTDVPQLSLVQLNQVRRLITLVDALYDAGVKLVVSAAKPPEHLFVSDLEAPIDTENVTKTSEAKKKSHQDEVFAFDRTVSRLIEMQSDSYLNSASSTTRSSVEFLSQFEVMRLSEEDIEQIWGNYTHKDSDELGIVKLRDMMEDLTELKSKHRNVSHEDVAMCFEALDTSGDGIVSKDEFVHYMKQYGMVHMAQGARDVQFIQ